VPLYNISSLHHTTAVLYNSTHCACTSPITCKTTDIVHEDSSVRLQLANKGSLAAQQTLKCTVCTVSCSGGTVTALRTATFVQLLLSSDI